jgi:hypothetical protein
MLWPRFRSRAIRSQIPAFCPHRSLRTTLPDPLVTSIFVPDGIGGRPWSRRLLSKSSSAASPLIAALTDTTMRAAERNAERSGGRLDPPLTVMLDEAANICRTG